jgi:hypothetical protein
VLVVREYSAQEFVHLLKMITEDTQAVDQLNLSQLLEAQLSVNKLMHQLIDRLEENTKKLNV